MVLRPQAMGNPRMSERNTARRLLVTAKEAAEMLSLGRSTFWQAVKDGHLPKPIKIGSATRWRIADLEQRFCEKSEGLIATDDAS